ncbi:unnamed protein product [Bursaphelenchus xylophilus]|uniref:(pine wood nematode) hypothetical protein n=1 Tax=Bursaphelenchus xylophilus TaxID=6326 RepID=A0A1I7S3T2_BURXY|nr:unnamed protein product [Bursaphelenchus xylophilus]CAG9116504.1 unnamed protein product [Bursaphelenchus xylophilus]
MQLTNISYLPNRPSVYLKFPNVSVLLDTAVNFDVLSNFMPLRIIKNQSSPLNNAVSPRDPNLAGLKKIGGELLIDAVPEVQPMTLSSIDFSKLDVILISSWMSLLSLPYITEETGFSGVVYCTEPTKELGGLAMEEMVNVMDRVKSDDNDWKEKPFWKTFGKSKTNDPRGWKPIYSREQMSNALKKVSLISFGETKVVNGLIKCTAYSSGHSIGSCNWILDYDSCKVGYVSSSAARPSHVRPAFWIPFKNISNLIVTSISRFPNADPASNAHRLSFTMVETLKRGGNVLFPISPVGNVFDLLEIIISAIDAGKASRDIPVYFISPVAASALAFVNIFPEYLVEQKSQRVYNADEPFVFNDLIKDNRIKVYSSIHGSFSKDFKPPCVVLTGHPSLRFGSAIHFLELWGNDKKNAVIVTGKSTWLDFNFLNKNLIPDLFPKQLIIPDTYCRGRANLTVTHNNIIKYKHGLPVEISGDFGRKRALVMPEVLKNMRMETKKVKMDVSLCSFSGYISTYDNDFTLLNELSDDAKTERKALKPRYLGVLSSDSLIGRLKRHGISADHGQSSVGECTVVNIPSLEAQVHITFGGSKSIIKCSSPENRTQIQKILFECLEQI